MANCPVEKNAQVSLCRGIWLGLVISAGNAHRLVLVRLPGPEHSAHVCFLSKHLHRLVQQFMQSYHKIFNNLAFSFLLTVRVLVALGFCSSDQQISSKSQVPDLFDSTLCAHLVTGILIHADVLAEIAARLIRTCRS